MFPPRLVEGHAQSSPKTLRRSGPWLQTTLHPLILTLKYISYLVSIPLATFTVDLEDINCPVFMAQPLQNFWKGGKFSPRALPVLLCTLQTKLMKVHILFCVLWPVIIVGKVEYMYLTNITHNLEEPIYWKDGISLRNNLTTC